MEYVLNLFIPPHDFFSSFGLPVILLLVFRWLTFIRGSGMSLLPMQQGGLPLSSSRMMLWLLIT